MKRRAQITRILVLLFGMLLAGVLAGASEVTALEIGDKAPDFTLPSTTGEGDQSESVQGQEAGSP